MKAFLTSISYSILALLLMGCQSNTYKLQGTAEGLEDGAALRLFAQAMIGSAKMMTDSGYSIDELIKMVSSPGGTTLAGLDKLYAGSLTDTVDACCNACTQRAYELAGAERNK